MTVVDFDVDLSVLEELDFDSPCDTDDCEKSADVRFKMICGHTYLFCNEHCGALITHLKFGGRVKCTVCGYKARHLVEIEITSLR